MHDFQETVKFTCSEWHLANMSRRFASSTVRLSLFSLKQCIITILLDSVFVIYEIIKVSVSVNIYQPKPSASANNTYLDRISQKSHPIIVLNSVQEA